MYADGFVTLLLWQDYYIDADYQVGDGFSFSGGAYSLLQYHFYFSNFLVTMFSFN